VVPTQSLDYLTLFPSSIGQPFVSTLNSFDGAVVANAAIIQKGIGDSVSAFVTHATDLILDTNGFFGAPGNPGELTFSSVVPCRVADTRNGTAGPIRSGDTREFVVAGNCGVPATAKAFVLNVTAVPNGPLAYLTLWPTGSGRPDVSTLNSFLGRVVANAAIVPSGVNGNVSVFAANETHVVLDINGYFQ
jgi:hypothetical protein